LYITGFGNWENQH